MKAKCIIVNRVSSIEQKDGYSLDAQSRRGNEYSDQNRFEVIKEFTFQESASKTRESRLFDEIMGFILAYTAQARNPLHVIVEKKDRWGRLHSRKEHIQNLVLEGKVVLHYYRENQVLDQDCSPEEIFMDDVVTSMNKYVGMNIGKEAKKGMIEKARQGWLPHKPPSGYINNPNKGSPIAILVDHKEKDFITRLFELRGKHFLSYQSIVERLKAENLVPERFKKTFRRSIVEKLLKNPFYRGKFVFAGTEYNGLHEKFLPEDLVTAVDATFEKSGRRLNKLDGIFSGALTCGECGCKISFHRKVKNGKVYRLYVCANGKRKHQTLKGLYKHESEIMNGLSSAIDDVSISEDFAKEIARALNRNEALLKQKIQQEKDDFRSAIQTLETDEDRLYADYKQGVIDKEFFDRNISRIRQEKTRVTELLLKIQDQANQTYLHTAKGILELAQNAKTLWFERSDKEKFEFLQKLLWNPRITGSTIEYELRKPFKVLSQMRANEAWGE